MESVDIMEAAVKALDGKKAKNIEVIKIGDLTIIADYFVIVSAASSTQVKALADEVEYRLSEQGVSPSHTEGRSTGWILLDYGSVAVHVFYEETRRFYDLERHWADGERIDISPLLSAD